MDGRNNLKNHSPVVQLTERKVREAVGTSKEKKKKREGVNLKILGLE